MVKNIIALLKDNKYSNTAVFLGNIRNDSGPYPYYAYHNGEKYVPYKYDTRVYEKGDEAIAEIGFDHKYLSGILMRRGFLDFAFLEKLNPYDGLITPQTILYTMALRYGKGVTVDLDFCVKLVNTVGKSLVSRVNGKSYKHPDNRFKQFTLYVKVADKIFKSDVYKIKALAKLFGVILDESTHGWNNLIKNPKRSIQYGVENYAQNNIFTTMTNYNERLLSWLEKHYDDKVFKKNLFIVLNSKYEYFINKRCSSG